MNIDNMTETEIRVAISKLETCASHGDLTPRQAARLTELKIALRGITDARRL